MSDETRRIESSVDYGWHDVWPRRPRRGESLPPGQWVLRVFPRFADKPRTPPPAVPATPTLKIRGAVGDELSLEFGRLQQLQRRELLADFHCVTTWSVFGLRWSGWRLADLWREVICRDARPSSEASHIVAVGLDGHRAILHLDDALAEDVFVVDTLAGAPLDLVHGAPLRLVSPQQYAYKSVKHLTAIEVHTSEPTRQLGNKEHPRARVDREERHATLPAWLVRWPYRAVVPMTAMMARHSARGAPRGKRLRTPWRDATLSPPNVVGLKAGKRLRVVIVGGRFGGLAAARPPKPGTGRPQYASSRNAAHFSRATVHRRRTAAEESSARYSPTSSRPSGKEAARLITCLAAEV